MRKTTIVITLILIAILFIMWTTITTVHSDSSDDQENSQLQTVVMPEPSVEEPTLNIMEVTATAYCPCQECSGPWGTSTATGAIAIEGRTIAVDPTVIPYGTEVIIDGNTYVAEDTGAAIKGNMIDIYFDSHKDTTQWGVQEIEIIIP